MFGYVMANQGDLSEASKERYRGAYCGLCHALGRKYGTFSRFTLNYDLAFLAIFLSALYAEPEQSETSGCILHPFKKRSFFCNAATDYAADMNIALSYYNLMDNWEDDRNLMSKAEAAALVKAKQKVEATYPRQCQAIKAALRDLSELEKNNELNPDLPASCFGRLMAEIFVMKEDQYANNLRRFGFALGRFIYLLDAMLDLKKDLKHEQYNPLVTFPTANFRESLCILMSDCTNAFHEFTKLQQDELLNNILYSGVWLKFEIQQARENKKNSKKGNN